jgi:hypothetical protein
VKIDRELAIAARARIRRRISSDAATQSDSSVATSSSEQVELRHARRALRHLCQEEPDPYLRLMASLLGSKTRHPRGQL